MVDEAMSLCSSSALNEFQWRIFPPPVHCVQQQQQQHLQSHLRNGVGSTAEETKTTNRERRRRTTTTTIATPTTCLAKKQQRRSCLQRSFIMSKAIVFVAETDDFRKLAYQVRSSTAFQGDDDAYDRDSSNPVSTSDDDPESMSDRVLEIGCSTGGLSKMLLQRRPSSWIGIDISQEMIDRCHGYLKDTISEVKDTTETKVVKVDAILEPAKAFKEATTLDKRNDRSLSSSSSPTVIFVDIGGNRDDKSVLKVLEWIFQSFLSNRRIETDVTSSPLSSRIRLVIVKSREVVSSILSSSLGGSISSTGVIANGSKWYIEAMKDLAHDLRPSLPKHPLRATMVLSPMDGATPICRYHNYHKKGCRRHNVTLEKNMEDETRPTEIDDDCLCPFDHDHCHACLQRGHVAQQCTLFCVPSN